MTVLCIISLYERAYDVKRIEQVKKCSFFLLSVLEDVWGRADGFQDRIFVLFLLTLPQMRNSYSYFKIGLYLNLLLRFSSPLA